MTRTSSDDTSPPLPRGPAVIEAALPTLPPGPGVYRMLDARGEALYVGKAKSLRKRVPAYTQPARLPERLRRMVMETAAVEVITTHTEAEALLLESNLIKRLKPRFNIVLRDDKSYPWLTLTGDHPFPQLAKHRGAQTRKGDYYGPYASAWAVNQAVTALSRAFLLRTCSDTVFANRTRPCLLYQIKRCSAPCVGRIDQAAYAGLVEQAKRFLDGDTTALQQELAAEMERAAEALDFERAATIRDRIRGLTHVQSTDVVNPGELGEADVIACHMAGGQSCVQVFFIRGGRNNGNRAHFPSHAKNDDESSVLSAFIGQFYDDKPPPRTVLLSHPVAEPELVAEALGLKAGRKVELAVPQRGAKRAVVEHALRNAREALERRLAEGTAQAVLLEGVARVFGLAAPPERIEVYDNSHTMGREPYGVMIVAGPQGFVKSAYRKFAIRGPVQPGDDFAMMREVLERRFGRALKEQPDRAPGTWPDLVLIDGGQGQLSAARETLAGLGIEDLPLVAIAKGPDRNAGRERFFVAGRQPIELPPRDPVLYYLQRLRDEAHRFAISAHRAGRQKAMGRSGLDAIEGVGPARRRALLNHFGSARGVAAAGLAALEACPGIDRALARRIYEHFHPGAGTDTLHRSG
ncbi:excinuclease ABC subunit UvrC [Elioraea sp.]|jgi:excinuclease ABC subunit C|uniref:excinuclease ABC subunit UvrC n=1 Tax=Elioraea sp. TaxID=2185103 RepID=UPI002616764E|nr:excinuclease ABC subunit UvrC [Elioraea sp.]